MTTTPLAPSPAAISPAATPACPTAPGAPVATCAEDVRAVVRHLLLDLVHARRTVGQPVHVPEVALATGASCAAVRLAVGRLCDLGLLLRSPFGTEAVVAWQPGQDRLLLRRLVRLVGVVAGRRPDLELLPEPPHRPEVAEAEGLTLPADLARVVALCRTLFTVLPGDLASEGAELLDLVELLCSDEASAAHDVLPGAPARVRDVVVDRLELAAHHGDWDAVREIAGDHATAFIREDRAQAPS